MQSLYALAQCQQSDYFLALEKITDSTEPVPEITPAHDLDSIRSEVRQLFKRSVLKGHLVPEPDLRPEVLASVENLLEFYKSQTQADFDHLYSNMVDGADRVENYLFSLLDLMVRWAESAELEHSKKNRSQPSIAGSSSNLFNNRIISVLRESLWLGAKKKIPAWTGSGNEAFRWFKDIVKKDANYLDYELMPAPSFEDDRAMVSYLIRKIIFKSEPIQSFMEEADINWEEDGAIVKSVLVKTLKAIREDQDQATFEIPGISYNWEEDRRYFRELFKNTVEGEKRFEKMIADKAHNWEMERIATLDKIILKMALCEMINFPSIPIKVTINEYIEISKLYSTPKSRHFVNGILDVLAKELKHTGVIKKSGRGLIDNK